MRVFPLVILALCLTACVESSSESGDAGTDGGDTDTDTDTEDPDCPNPSTLHEEAGLYWQHCLAGQCWFENPESGVEECTGDPLELEWQDAQDSCPNGWRLPTRDELMGLLGGCDQLDTDEDQVQCDPCFEREVCDAIYPGVEDLPDISRLHLHWSSTEYDATNAWFARFKEGVVRKDSITKKYTLVCCRDAE